MVELSTIERVLLAGVPVVGLAYVTVWAAGWNQFETVFRILLIVWFFAVGGSYAISYARSD